MHMAGSGLGFRVMMCSCNRDARGIVHNTDHNEMFEHYNRDAIRPLVHEPC